MEFGLIAVISLIILTFVTVATGIKLRLYGYCLTLNLFIYAM